MQVVREEEIVKQAEPITNSNAFAMLEEDEETTTENETPAEKSVGNSAEKVAETTQEVEKLTVDEKKDETS